ncbi:MAG: DUF4968 domain-containing protein [Bacteroidetes bacterium]|nr:MAG: DUF4968 domain-containing protein [Bacteroidota bacterium]
MESSRQDIRNRKQFPQLVQKWEQIGSRFYFYCPETVLEVSVYAENIVRFRFSPEGRFEDDFSYAVKTHKLDTRGDFEVKQVGDEFHLVTEQLVCNISKTLRINIFNSEGKLLSEDERGFHWEPHPSKGGNIVYYSRKIQEQESFWGLGDKPREMNLRGMRLENWGADTYGFEKQTDPLYKNIPFFMGLHDGQAYGIFFDNTFRTRFDFGYERGDVMSFWAKGGEMTYYFIYGPELTTVAESYTYLTGRPKLPPLWALGYQQSKWSYYPESQVKEIASGLRERKIPCDVIHLDIDYMDGFRCFTWDQERFPDPKRMISELEEDGFKTVVIIDPGIKKDKEYFVYQQAIEAGYFCRRADGPLMEGDVWPGACHFPDFTNPEVRKWWAGLYEEFMKSGIRGVWNDMNEPAVFEIGTFPDDTRHDFDGHPCSHRKAHNIYGMQMARATYHGVKDALFPHRPVVITRSGYSGLQRYSAVWTGDNIATWEHLWMANIMCQRLSISGVSFCGSDVGGFIGQPSGELYVRWIQLALFHPFFRTHSSGDHGDQEPWSFGEKYLDIVRKMIELRYQLLPYMYTVFRQHCEYGTPVLLPLVFLDQNDPETHYRMEEFGLGRDLLMCPITTEGAEGRIMYLPRGQWYHYWSDKLWEGGKEIYVEAPLEEVPLFVRAGAVIPHYPVQQYVGEKRIEELTLHVYFLDGAYTSTLYEDAGDFYDYAQGNFTLRTFEVTGSKSRLDIVQTREGRFNSEYNIYRIVLHGLPFLPAGMLLDGETVVFDQEQDPSTKTFEFEVPKKFQQLSVMRLDGFAALED